MDNIMKDNKLATSNAFKQFAYGITMTLFFSYVVFIAIVCISNAL